jgi:hypothetical protein
VALAGPDPRTLIDPVDADDLRHAAVSLLHSWWMTTPRCRRWLDNPFHRSYGVLTMCRMRYTLQYGVVVSKAMTARWAQAALDARWTPLIEAALAGSNDNVPDLGETLGERAGRPVPASGPSSSLSTPPELTGSPGNRLTGNRRFDNHSQ